MSYDYIIAGGGSAGCVMAARLSEDPSVKVLLLEAGGGGNDIFIRAPALVAAMVSGRPKINNWALKTVPQAGLGNRRGFQPRGRGLGGSSAINAMLYVRGHPADYDEWADLGCEGWDWQSVLPYFLKSEGNARGASDLHSSKGPLQIANQSAPREITDAFVEACSETQIARNDDFNGPRQDGAGLYQVTHFHDGPHKGERCSAFAAYLRGAAAKRANLTIIRGALVHNVMVEDRRAVGICYKHGGKVQHARAARDVILCAGTFGTPQILMLSGIGAADELRTHGVEIVHDLPGVGKNLQDHLDYVISYTSKRRDVVGLNPSGLLALGKAALEWRKTGEGLFATPFAEGGAFFKTSPDLDRPDAQLHFVVGIVDDHMRKLHLAHGFSCHVCALRPYSRGTVGLASANPAKAPRIDPNFLGDPRDLAVLKAGARKVEQVLQSRPLSPWRGKRLYAHDGSDDALEADIRRRADTIYHPVGTCRMGTDEMAVTDTQGRVHGLEGLRIVDASLMPRLVGGNTNAPTIMMAEKIADEMLRDA